MNYYNEIKNKLIDNEINRKVKKYSINRSDLNTYYNVGKILSEAGKHYGEGIIKEYSIKLTNELGKGYTQSRFRYFRRFYNVFSKCPTLSDKYYIDLSVDHNLSVRQLRDRIKSNEYERLDEVAKNKLRNKEKNNVTDLVKNPILIKNSYNYENITEKLLQKLILEDIVSFMKELGTGFSFIDNEFKIKVGDSYNYIDLLLYNIKFKCYVVIELKVIKLNSNHTGQIQNYMNYIDKNVKGIDDNKTVGIIICKQNNQYVIDYCSDDRIIAREYELV